MGRPSSHLVTLKDCGHFPYLEGPLLCQSKLTPSFVARSMPYHRRSLLL
jgi:pimeloyl-ACP methyl ester carboxylesterase